VKFRLYPWLLWSAALAWSACDATQGEVPDKDGDGSPTAEDCNDEDTAVHPGAVEVCDGVDTNCNGLVDGGMPQRHILRVGSGGEATRDPVVGSIAPAVHTTHSVAIPPDTPLRSPHASARLFVPPAPPAADGLRHR
jgi:Putative metal-binding motif